MRVVNLKLTVLVFLTMCLTLNEKKQDLFRLLKLLYLRQIYHHVVFIDGDVVITVVSEYIGLSFESRMIYVIFGYWNIY